MIRAPYILSALLLLCALPYSSSAQSTSLQTDGTSYYTFVQPGQNTIQVLLVGDIRQPGLYEVGEDMELVRLIGLGGGAGTELQTTRRHRRVTVELHRNTPGQSRNLVYESSFDDLVSHAEPPPALEMGDVIQVRVIERDRFNWRDGLTLAATVTSLAWGITRIINLLD